MRGLSPLDGGDALLWTSNSKVVMVGVIRSSWVWIYFKGRAVRISWWIEIRGLFTSFKIVTTIDYINKTVPKSYAFTSVTLHSKHS